MMKNLNENITHEDSNTDDEREEWMFMAELNVENITECNHSIIPPDGYWHEALQFSARMWLVQCPHGFLGKKSK